MAAGEATVVHATREDVSEILAMIKEHAEYEGSPASCLTTEESLVRTLSFAPSTQHTNSGYARALLLRLPTHPSNPEDQPGAIAGLAVYVHNYSTWRGKPGVFLDDLFVRPQYRKRGYGKLLLQTLAQEVMKIDGCRLEWSCSVMNQSSLKWYRSLGAKEMEEWIPLRLEWDALENLALGKSPARNIQPKSHGVEAK